MGSWVGQMRIDACIESVSAASAGDSGQTCQARYIQDRWLRLPVSGVLETSVLLRPAPDREISPGHDGPPVLGRRNSQIGAVNRTTGRTTLQSHYRVDDVGPWWGLGLQSVMVPGVVGGDVAVGLDGLGVAAEGVVVFAAGVAANGVAFFRGAGGQSQAAGLVAGSGVDDEFGSCSGPAAEDATGRDAERQPDAHLGVGGYLPFPDDTVAFPPAVGGRRNPGAPR